MMSLLGFPFSLLGIFRLIPAALRDAVYDLIARNRKRWFGKTTKCRIPAPRNGIASSDRRGCLPPDELDRQFKVGWSGCVPSD
jgi:hypothetical protein